MDLSKYLASWKAYHSHIDWGVLVCAGVACPAIILIILPVGHGCLSALLLVAVIVAFPVALYDGDYNRTARTEKGEWVRGTLTVRSPKAGFFDAKGRPVRPVESR